MTPLRSRYVVYFSGLGAAVMSLCGEAVGIVGLVNP